MILGKTSFASPDWLTFNQVKTLSGRVKKGSKSELVIFWKVFNRGQETDEAKRAATTSTAARDGDILAHFNALCFLIVNFINGL
jgi:antirestriction protein ArdC